VGKTYASVCLTFALAGAPMFARTSGFVSPSRGNVGRVSRLWKAGACARAGSRPFRFNSIGPRGRRARVRISLSADKRFNEPRKNIRGRPRVRDVRAFLTSSYRRFNGVFNASNRSQQQQQPPCDSHSPPPARRPPAVRRARGDVFKAAARGTLLPSLSVARLSLSPSLSLAQTDVINVKLPRAPFNARDARDATRRVLTPDACPTIRPNLLTFNVNVRRPSCRLSRTIPRALSRAHGTGCGIPRRPLDSRFAHARDTPRDLWINGSPLDCSIA